MKKSFSMFDPFGMCSFLTIVAIVGTLCALSFFQQPDSRIHDLLLACQTTSDDDSDVVLVYAPTEWFSDPQCGQLNDLVNILAESRAKKIGLLFTPDEQQTKSLADNRYAKDLTVGAASVATRDSSTTTQTDFLTTGSTALLLDQPVYRSHPTSWPVLNDGTACESIAMVIAQQVLNNKKLPTGTSIGIRFAGAPNSLPHVNAAGVLDGSIVSEMIQNRVVLIGINAPVSKGFITPTTGSGPRMSELELQGNILHTILEEQSMLHSPNWWTATLLILVTLAGVQVFRQVKPRQFPLVMIGGVLLILISQLAACWFFNLLSSVSALLTAFIASMFTALYLRLRCLNDSVNTLQLARNVILPGNEAGTDAEIWSAVAQSIYQTACPSRMVLMELERGANSLTIAKTVQCKEEEIAERRRDVHRTPYLEPAEQSVAMVSEHRKFFVANGSEIETVEYFVPLIVLAELRGFIVLEMAAEEVNAWSDFENYLNQMGADVAAYIDSQKSIGSSRQDAATLKRRLHTIPERIQISELSRTDNELVSTTDIASSVVKSTRVAIAVCNSFGEPTTINPRMSQLLQQRGTAVANIDSTILLESLTGLDKNRCRELFRNCLMGREKQQVSVAAGNGHDSILVCLDPVGGDSPIRDMTTRFVNIQVVEGEKLDRVGDWHLQYERHASEQLKERVAGLRTTARRLQQLPQHATEKAIAKLIAELDDCSQLAAGNLDENPAHSLAFDTRAVLESVIDWKQQELDSNVNIVARFEEGCDELTSIVNPLLLEQVFVSLLDCVSKDVREGSEVHVEATAIDRKISVQFSCHTPEGEQQNVDSEGSDDVYLKVARRDSKSVEEAPRTVADDLDESSISEIRLDGNVESILTPTQLDQFKKIEKWLVAWGASLKVRCCERFHLSAELVLDLHDADSIKPASIRSIHQTSSQKKGG